MWVQCSSDHKKIRDASERKQRLIELWDGLQQTDIDEAIDE